ncbi:PRC-barrel domain-containing protein [Pedobacter sp. L105]|uniref:PRC-barrel domain-containing protein n=1 Tax=Pedobacter sp. L105 TaxID=1641871 RepID=UPI00131C404A|nr:PRC-barrel domain-containing protein [Pedobacter sp. L105]
MEHKENNRTTYLEELSGSDYEIADDQPDISGWRIADSSGSEIGEVKDLIFDSNAGKVRYLISSIDVDADRDGDKETRVVLIPIGVVSFDEKKDEVILPAVYTYRLGTLPEYESGKIISPVEELAIRYAFLGKDSLPHADSVVYESHPDDFYDHDHFNDNHFTRS